MDKKAVNNEIVRMRPIANKTKIGTISKLTREVKNLRKPKDYHNEAQKQKNASKIERLVDELLLMKKIKHDDISKFALTHSKKEIMAIQSKPDSSLETRCMCRLALHGGLVAHVIQFQSQFPEWESTLVPLINSIGVKEKRKKVIARQVALIRTKAASVEKEIQKMSSDSDEFSIKVELEEEKLDSDSDEANTTDNSNSSKFQIERRDDNTDNEGSDEKEPSSNLLNSAGYKKNVVKQCSEILKLKQPTIKVKTKTKNNKSKLSKVVSTSGSKPLKCIPTSTTGSSPLETCPSSSEVHISKVKVKKAANSKQIEELAKKNDHKMSKKDTKGKVINRNKIMKVMRFTELVQSNENCDTFFESVNEGASNLGPKTVDSFFVTDGGKSEFFSSVPTKETVEKNEHVTSTPQEMYDSSGRRLNRREIRARLHGGYSVEMFPSKSNSPKHIGNQRFNTEVRQAPKRNNQHTSQPKTIIQPADEILHPSWEAKKKQKEQLNIGFQGKKIKFDN